MGNGASVALAEAEKVTDDALEQYIIELCSENKRTRLKVLNLLNDSLSIDRRRGSTFRRLFSQKDLSNSQGPASPQQGSIKSFGRERDRDALITLYVERFFLVHVLTRVIDECIEQESVVFAICDTATESTKLLFELLTTSLDVARHLSRCRPVQAFLASQESSLTLSLQKVINAYSRHAKHASSIATDEIVIMSLAILQNLSGALKLPKCAHGEGLLEGIIAATSYSNPDIYATAFGTLIVLAETAENSVCMGNMGYPVDIVDHLVDLLAGSRGSTEEKDEDEYSVDADFISDPQSQPLAVVSRNSGNAKKGSDTRVLFALETLTRLCSSETICRQLSTPSNLSIIIGMLEGGRKRGELLQGCLVVLSKLAHSDVGRLTLLRKASTWGLVEVLRTLLLTGRSATRLYILRIIQCLIGRGEVCAHSVCSSTVPLDLNSSNESDKLSQSFSLAMCPSLTPSAWNHPTPLPSSNQGDNHTFITFVQLLRYLAMSPTSGQGDPNSTSSAATTSEGNVEVQQSALSVLSSLASINVEFAIAVWADDEESGVQAAGPVPVVAFLAETLENVFDATQYQMFPTLSFISVRIHDIEAIRVLCVLSTYPDLASRLRAWNVLPRLFPLLLQHNDPDSLEGSCEELVTLLFLQVAAAKNVVNASAPASGGGLAGAGLETLLANFLRDERISLKYSTTKSTAYNTVSRTIASDQLISVAEKPRHRQIAAIRVLMVLLANSDAGEGLLMEEFPHILPFIVDDLLGSHLTECYKYLTILRADIRASGELDDAPAEKATLRALFVESSVFSFGTLSPLESDTYATTVDTTLSSAQTATAASTSDSSIRSERIQAVKVSLLQLLRAIQLVAITEQKGLYLARRVEMLLRLLCVLVEMHRGVQQCRDRDAEQASRTHGISPESRLLNDQQYAISWCIVTIIDILLLLSFKFHEYWRDETSHTCFMALLAPTGGLGGTPHLLSEILSELLDDCDETDHIMDHLNEHHSHHHRHSHHRVHKNNHGGSLRTLGKHAMLPFSTRRVLLLLLSRMKHPTIWPPDKPETHLEAGSLLEQLDSILDSRAQQAKLDSAPKTAKEIAAALAKSRAEQEVVISIVPFKLPGGTKKHVSLSYCRATPNSRHLVGMLRDKLADLLKAEVWFDCAGSKYVASNQNALDVHAHKRSDSNCGSDEVDVPQTDHSLSSMNISVLVIIFVSKEYFADPRCRAEALHARELQKRGHCAVIFVTLDQSYTTISFPPITGWLAGIMGNSTWFALWGQSFVDFAAGRIASAVGGSSWTIDPGNKDLSSAYIIPDVAASDLTFKNIK